MTVLMLAEQLHWWTLLSHKHKHTHTHKWQVLRPSGFCPGLPRWADTRKVKPICILLKQEIASVSGVSLDICRSAPRPRQITMPASHHSVFYRPDALPSTNQQRQSTEGSELFYHLTSKYVLYGISNKISSCMIHYNPKAWYDQSFVENTVKS